MRFMGGGPEYVRSLELSCACVKRHLNGHGELRRKCGEWRESGGGGGGGTRRKLHRKLSRNSFFPVAWFLEVAGGGGEGWIKTRLRQGSGEGSW